MGLGHLGTVTAACLAEHYDVICYDPNYNSAIHPFRDDRDPGVGYLFDQGERSGNIKITHSPSALGEQVDAIWICLDAQSTEDYDANFELVHHVLTMAPAGMLVIVSSPLRTGTMAKLTEKYTLLRFVYQPENLRMGRGIMCFKMPDRIVLGISDPSQREFLTKLFKPFCNVGNEQLLFMSPESAEMVKHGINAFLATTIAFANEFGKFCIKNGASTRDVERGLKSDSRIGPRAYLAYGDPPGSHLSRDIDLLSDLCGGIFTAVKTSNESFGR